MDKTRETRIARRSLLSDPTSSNYLYWQGVTREVLEKVKDVISHPGCTRRETAAFLLAHRLHTEIADD